MSACRLSVSERYNPVLSIHATRHVASLFMLCELSDRSLPRLEESRCGVPPQTLSRSPGRARLSQARDGCLGWFESKVNICSIITVVAIVAIIIRIVPTTCGSFLFPMPAISLRGLLPHSSQFLAHSVSGVHPKHKATKSHIKPSKP